MERVWTSRSLALLARARSSPLAASLSPLRWLGNLAESPYNVAPYEPQGADSRQ